MRDDERMLERLGRALAPPAVQPSEAELGRVRRAVRRVRSRRPGPPEPAPGPAAADGRAVVVVLPPRVLAAPTPGGRARPAATAGRELVPPG